MKCPGCHSVLPPHVTCENSRDSAESELSWLSRPDEATNPEPEFDPTLVLLTVEEAARRLRIGRTYCYRLIRTGELESVPVGRLRRVPVDAVPEYAARLRKSNRNRTAA
ncbi:excisionase family DNA-binding protein [Streptomyces sp. NA02950]|nr:excisionase family DNA-binding protein [Streptomyces sp. NA02950]